MKHVERSSELVVFLVRNEQDIGASPFSFEVNLVVGLNTDAVVVLGKRRTIQERGDEDHTAVGKE